MNGVPADLPVQALVGCDLTHIGLSMHTIQLHFEKDGYISIEGDWCLRDSRGLAIDQSIDPPSSRKSYQIHRLLMQSVVAASVDAPESFTLTFANGDSLTVLDSWPTYESFTLRVNGCGFYI